MDTNLLSASMTVPVGKHAQPFAANTPGLTNKGKKYPYYREKALFEQNSGI
jgi:hypothetical protein